MVATRIKTTLSIFTLFFINAKSVLAEMMEKGKTKVKTVFNLYHQNSNDGAQVVDNRGREEANVVEPMIFIEHQVTEKTAIDARIVFDAWTAASDTKLDEYTGQSGGEPIKTQSRIAADLGFRSELKKWTYGASFGFSSEYDYQSMNATVHASRSFAKDNFTLGASLQFYKDELSLFNDITPPGSAVISEGKKRDIFAGSLSASQILTTKDIASFEFTYARSSKFLESTASTVLVNGIREVESLPDSRNRYGFTTKWVSGLSDTSAMNLTYRYYFDDWGINSHTIKPAYLFELNEDEDYIEIYGRFYTQTQADYFRYSFDSIEENMTSDSDMGAFDSYEAGVFYEQNLEDRSWFGIEIENLTWGNGFVYTNRTNGMRYGYYQTSFKVEF